MRRWPLIVVAGSLLAGVAVFLAVRFSHKTMEATDTTTTAPVAGVEPVDVIKEDQGVTTTPVIESTKTPASVRMNAAGSNAAARPPSIPLVSPEAAAKRPPSVLAVLGHAPDRSYTARLAAVQRLPASASFEESHVLLKFLDSRLSEQGDLEPMALNAIKNDTLAYLLRQKVLPAGIGEQLVKMYRDRNHDVIWRGYCVQFFGDYYDKAWPAGADTNPDPLRKQFEAAYWEALAETDSQIAGTALIGIELLSRKHPELDRTKIGRKALDLATDQKMNANTRLTAIQVCAVMGLKEVLQTARIEAQAGENTILRVAAISAIGQVGSPEDADLLQGIAASSDQYPAKAAAKALEHLRRRTKDAGG